MRFVSLGQEVGGIDPHQNDEPLCGSLVLG
jgi:hypothetical protein